jgi:hypothetical protein
MPGIDLYDTPELTQGTCPLGQPGRHASLKPRKSRRCPAPQENSREDIVSYFLGGVKCTNSTLFAGLVGSLSCQQAAGRPEVRKNVFYLWPSARIAVVLTQGTASRGLSTF